MIVARLWLVACGAGVAFAGWMEASNAAFVDVAWPAAGPLIALLVRRRVEGAVAVALAAAWLVLARDPTGPVAARTVVLGVDGATFDVIDSMDLPNFARLRRDGTRAPLTSMEPMFSPLLWTTMASGRTPDEHGIRGFRVQASDCRVARFWDVAEHEGRSIGLYKWLVDYPPRRFRTGGFWVPSWLAPAPDADPPELAVVKEVELSRRLRRKRVEARSDAASQALALARAGVRLSTLAEAAAWSLQERCCHPDALRRNVVMQHIRGDIDRDVFLWQLRVRAPELATLTYYATDGLAHLYWDRHAAGGDELRGAYRQADGILGELRGVLSPEARLLVVSDHGFRAMDGSGQAGQFAPLTERLRARMGEAGIVADVTRLGHKVVVATADAATKEAARAWLAGLTDAGGAPFYVLADLPDNRLSIGLTLADEAISSQRLAADTVSGEPIAGYVVLTDAYTGTHDPRGVFYAVGPGATAGAEIPAVSMLDVAPTILAAAGLPASEKMPGRAAVFREVPRVPDWDFLVANLEWLHGEQGVDEEALKAIGYVQ